MEQKDLTQCKKIVKGWKNWLLDPVDRALTDICRYLTLGVMVSLLSFLQVLKTLLFQQAFQVDVSIPVCNCIRTAFTSFINGIVLKCLYGIYIGIF